MCGPRGEKPLDPGGSFLIIIFSDARRKGGMTGEKLDSGA